MSKPSTIPGWALANTYKEEEKVAEYYGMTREEFVRRREEFHQGFQFIEEHSALKKVEVGALQEYKDRLAAREKAIREKEESLKLKDAQLRTRESNVEVLHQRVMEMRSKLGQPDELLRNLCPVCFLQPAFSGGSWMVMNCGHLVCEECMKKYKFQKCHTCRKQVSLSFKVFIG